jgi:DNA repair exonuclease SbcCD ATPase subunit
VPEDLAAAAERFAELSTLIDAESELAAVLAERAEAERRRAAELAARADEVADFAARWSQRRADARVAAHAKALLWDCHDTLSSGLRPALESTIAQMVARLSDGRFSEVQVSDDYEVKVRDHTAWRNLSELSGGEQDLVALAVRLALSVVVSERAMGAAPSLLVLDEVFGSQDGLRRETIMSSLRDLRSRWSQVWLISHVGGLAEVADRVVELAVVDDPDIAGETRSDVTVV